jgi:hypothetical protein
VILFQTLFSKKRKIEKNIIPSGCFLPCQKKANIGNLARKSRVKLNAFHAEGQF